MVYSDFSFNGVLASTMGVVVTEQVSYIRPGERVDRVEVPGRPGKITLPYTATWDPVVYTPVCLLKPDADVDAVMGWLRGSGQVVFGSMPSFAFDARLISQFPTQSMYQTANGYKTFSPVFECHPFRKLSTEAPEIVATDGMMIHNPGNVESAPLIEVVGTGNFTLSIGGKSVVVQGIADIGGIAMDSELQDAFTLDFGQLANEYMEGEFLTIPPGNTYITWTVTDGEISSVTITPRWRWL